MELKQRFRTIICLTISLLSVVGLHAQQLTATLTGSMHNGSGVPCFGKKEGTITTTVTGGTTPYTYLWSNGETTPHLSGIAAGYYSVEVKDAAAAVVKVEITLTEPEPLKLKPTVSSFENGENISCFECNNGWIQAGATQGTPPYSYTWDDSPSTSANRYGLGPKEYQVTVTDANGCEESAVVKITQPERTDWTMSGNAGTDPGTQYIGTSDNKDLVFKANGQESFRLKANGAISLLGSLSEAGPLSRTGSGELRIGDPDDWPTIEPAPCTDLRPHRYWKTWGNSFTGVCEEEIPKLGTIGGVPLRFITFNQQRMIITGTGKVGIGTEPPAGAVGTYRLFVEGGVVCRDVLVKTGPFPDYVFQPNYALLPMKEFRDYIHTERHLPGIPSATEVEAKGGVEVGDLQVRMLRALEEQALYILQLEERLQAAEQRIEDLNRGK